MLVTGHLLNRLVHLRIKRLTNRRDRLDPVPSQHTNHLLHDHLHTSNQIGSRFVRLGRQDRTL